MEGQIPIRISQEDRNASIEVRASLDALKYIELMLRKSPEGLAKGENGRIVLNVADGFGKSIISKAEQELRLQGQEVLIYVQHLEVAVNHMV